ncbi:MAG: hypothetical protein V3T23_07975 [Nitrososphaerales archaeon]
MESKVVKILVGLIILLTVWGGMNVVSGIQDFADSREAKIESMLSQ